MYYCMHETMQAYIPTLIRYRLPLDVQFAVHAHDH
jgi:hypothetical protein